MLAKNAITRRSAKSTLIVFDPALQGYSGHHLEFARLIKSQLSSAFDVKFYCNFWAPTEIVAELPARPVCRDSIYPQPGDFQTINAQQCESLLGSLRKVDLRELTPRTIFVIHTLTVYQLGGLAEWFAALPSAHRPRLFLQFQFPLEYGVERQSEWPSALSVARRAADELSNAGKVIFATNSDLLKDRLTLQLGHTHRLMPVPTKWPNQVHEIHDAAGPVFGFYGGLRPEKGSRPLAEAISAFAERYSDTHFIVHAPWNECDEISVSHLSNSQQVELIRTNFKDKDAYFDQFCRAHFVLLPYDPAIYAHRTSGVFIEALGIGRPVITTCGTWMAHQLGKWSAAGLTMASYSASALYDCLEVARHTVIQRSWKSHLHHEIISSNTAFAFCSALIRAMQD
jgi:glycosyltransferase involved in cell wall biosynthesis